MNQNNIIKKERLVCEKLRDLRLSKGLSQDALASECGVDRKTINRIENNHFSPSMNTLFRLCKALNIKPAELLKVVK